MKKIILSLVAVFAFSFANAQDVPAGNGFVKGNKFVEGSLFIKSGDNVQDSWSFNPSMGYMLDNKWAIGGRLNFGGGDLINNSGKYSNIGVTAFARYYFLTLGASKSFNAYGEVGLGYTSKTNDPDLGNKTTDGAMNANVDLGMNYFFTSHWAVTFELANILSYNSYNPENAGSSSDLEVNVNLYKNIFDQPTFGLLYRW